MLAMSRSAPPKGHTIGPSSGTSSFCTGTHVPFSTDTVRLASTANINPIWWFFTVLRFFSQEYRQGI